MKAIAQLIKTSLPDYEKKAEEAYNRPLNHLWNKEMYIGNPAFEKLKNNYMDKDLTRDRIFELFREKKYYDGFLCAMVWGNIGTYRGGEKHFTDVFNANQQNIEDKIESVINILQAKNIKEAYYSLCYKHDNKIDGIAESFFTKLLYFASADISGLPFQPLIYDKKMAKIYEKILYRLGTGQKPTIGYNNYANYCYTIEKLNQELKLKNAGYLEALLFQYGNKIF